MSLTSYIGCNVPIAEKGYEDVSVEGEIFVGPAMAGIEERAEVKAAQFSTTYVYEVTFNGWGMELCSYQDKEDYEKHKEGLHQVCEMMNSYLGPGNFFEFYSCWVGEESDPRKLEMTLPIQDWYTEGMELREQTLIRFVKNAS